MLAIYTAAAFSIGTADSTFQPIVVSNRLKNVPTEEVFSFQPGSYFGVFMMDTFWLADKAGGE